MLNQEDVGLDGKLTREDGYLSERKRVMNKFESRRQYLTHMFYATLNNQQLNLGFMLQLIGDLMIEKLIWEDIVDPEEYYGEDKNEYMAFIEGCR